MKDFRKNSTKKKGFIDSLPQSSIETSNIETRCKFNFSYFDDTQKSGQSISEWGVSTGISSLDNLFKKLIEYTKEPLDYWRKERVGSGGLKVLEIYDKFPSRSDFKHPPHIPHDVSWARFRLGSKVRLVGFVISKTITNEKSPNLDSNTFYVAFLDKEHKFYKTEKS